MKKIILSLIATLFAINFSYAQTNTFPSTGNVGVGTTSPSHLLDVNGTGNFAGTITSTVSSNLVMGAGSGTTSILYSYEANSGGFLQYGLEGSAGGQLIIGGLPYAGIIGQYQNKPLQFGTNNTVRMTIDGSGNVGIGTISPSTFGGFAVRGYASVNSKDVSASFSDAINSTLDIRHPAASINDISSENSSLTFSTTTSGTDGIERIRINTNGNVGIGTSNPDQKLTVKGTIHSQEVIVDMSVLPDYVFKPAYHLPTLNEVKAYIDQNHHLSEMPSAEQVAKDGLSLGDMNAKLLKKVEELTLYLIEQSTENKLCGEKLRNQQDELNNQKEINQSQQKEIDELKQKVSDLIKSKQ